MPQEIERKFLVNIPLWDKLNKPEPEHFRQGYLFSNPEKTIRVRTTNSTAFITIKGKSNGASRSEFEYEIPRNEAIELLNEFSETELSKARYHINHEGHLWEVDVFEGENHGLIVAEIELQDENEKFEIPEWISEEVTEDTRYYNSNLTKNPFSKWKSGLAIN